VRGETTVRFSLARNADVELSLCDVLGRVRRVLARGPRTAGQHSIVLQAAGLTSGRYQLLLRASGAVRTRPVVILR